MKSKKPGKKKKKKKTVRKGLIRARHGSGVRGLARVYPEEKKATLLGHKDMMM